MVLRLTVANNAKQTEKSVLLLKTTGDGANLVESIINHAKKKLRLKGKTFRLFSLKEGNELLVSEDILRLPTDSVVCVSCGEDFVGKAPSNTAALAQPSTTEIAINVFASRSFIHEDAVAQLERTARQLPGVKIAAGMPDLHPGNLHPIGASFATEGYVYPALVGSDIGCGMLLKKTSLNRDSDPRKLASKLMGLEGPWSTEQDRLTWLEAAQIPPSGYEDSLGTIGAGNHFAEIQIVERMEDPAECARLGIDPSKALLLVHSGSRGFGQSILDSHTAKFGNKGLELGITEANEYLDKHGTAIQWARRNRALIAHRIFEALGLDNDSEQILDVWHNFVERKPFPDHVSELFIHRKGAAPSDRGPIVIPGSRGTFSYLVQPLDAGHDSALSCYSLAHGAGRLLTRHKALEKIGDLARKKGIDLENTLLGSVVVCSDKTLLYEEAPEAYKASEDVVEDLVERGLCKVLAVLRPLVTYKVR